MIKRNMTLFLMSDFKREPWDWKMIILNMKYITLRSEEEPDVRRSLPKINSSAARPPINESIVANIWLRVIWYCSLVGI